MNDNTIIFDNSYQNSLNVTHQRYSINIPKYEAWLVISNELRVQVKKKPNWFHRLMHRLFFGFHYIDTLD